MIMLAYFLVLYGGVGFIQDKRFFSSAPKENLERIPDTKERFPGVHIIGWIIEIIALLLLFCYLYSGLRGDRMDLHLYISKSFKAAISSMWM